ncbi:malate dehydrogenase [Sporomusa sphaeroides]|uniref:L-lactate dehydrogenase n=2 Tax=Sporomusa TaxID=2375 RepID=A0ABP2CEU4_9FIRM|nr:lactate dehydrogenase [Sporomusa sphaeroides]OLS57566.1 L-lactate dehydrogenase [Sporomusa sphaeroides DSM 2875]CVK20738.1 L-lactate dehydrogenase [Sporomusa sphaeroides DSM 2875]SCM81084.1 Lactate/malate dehydrogenase [uncultured Sporomusa sp.]
MKISFIGSGKVGVAAAYTAALKGLAQEILLTDASADKAYGEALDLLQCQAFCPQARITHGQIRDTANSDIVVISAGIPRRADEPRVMLLSRNASLIAAIVKEAVALSPQCILLIITNPLDVMTHLAYQVSGLPAERVIGMGTVLDTARYRSYLAQHFSVDARDIDAYVIGEHGETMVPLTGNITIKGVPLATLPAYDNTVITRIGQEVEAASGQVIALKGGTIYAPAASACEILGAIVNDDRKVLPVSSFNSRYKTAVSLPTVVGRHGAGPVLNIPMSPSETTAFAHSVANIKRYVDELEV